MLVLFDVITSVALDKCNIIEERCAKNQASNMMNSQFLFRADEVAQDALLQ